MFDMRYNDDDHGWSIDDEGPHLALSCDGCDEMRSDPDATWCEYIAAFGYHPECMKCNDGIGTNECRQACADGPVFECSECDSDKPGTLETLPSGKTRGTCHSGHVQWEI